VEAGLPYNFCETAPGELRTKVKKAKPSIQATPFLKGDANVFIGEIVNDSISK
jgi:hypothetical protein